MLLLAPRAAALLWFHTTEGEMGHFSRERGSEINMYFQKKARIAWRIGADGVAHSCGITGETTTAVSQRGERSANGRGILTSLPAEGGFCPGRGVMSPPLCGGAVDGNHSPNFIFIYDLLLNYNQQNAARL